MPFGHSQKKYHNFFLNIIRIGCSELCTRPFYLKIFIFNEPEYFLSYILSKFLQNNIFISKDRRDINICDIKLFFFTNCIMSFIFLATKMNDY